MNYFCVHFEHTYIHNKNHYSIFSYHLVRRRDFTSNYMITI